MGISLSRSRRFEQWLYDKDFRNYTLAPQFTFFSNSEVAGFLQVYHLVDTR